MFASAIRLTLLAICLILHSVQAAGGAIAPAPCILWNIGAPDMSAREFHGGADGLVEFTDDPIYVVGASNAAEHWPYVHPGPLDAWAGSRSHTFAVRFPLDPVPDGPVHLVLDVLDAHHSNPPVLIVTLNGTDFAHVQLPPGESGETARPDSSGARPHRVVVPVPSERLQEGWNRLHLETRRGRSFVYDRLALVLGSVETAEACVPVTEEASDPMVTAEIEAAHYGETGRVQISLEFTPTGPLPDRYRVLLHFVDPYEGEPVLVADHVPPIPTDRWEAGKPVRYHLTAVVPAGEDGGRSPLLVLAGIVNPLEEEFWGRIRLRGRAPFHDRRYQVGLLPGTESSTSVTELREEARRCADEGDSAAAFSLLEEAVRRSTELTDKIAATTDLLALKPPPPDPVSALDLLRMRTTVDNEKIRWLRDRASALLGQKEYRLALRLMERIGGVVEEGRNTKVIGEPTMVERVKRDIVDVKSRLLRDYSEEDLADSHRIVEEAAGDSDRLVAAARSAMKVGRLRLARRLLIEARVLPGATPDLKSKATALLETVDGELTSVLTPAEKARLPHEMDHPAFHRLSTVSSRRFLFVGPTKLIRSIASASAHRLDVAAVLLEDLFDQYPVARGERIIVFFSETHPRPGPAGGYRIVVGEAKPDPKEARVDSAWWYHELTHCVELTRPVHDYKRGMIEGLANVGAVCVEDMFSGKRGRFPELSRRGREAFARFHLARESSYWLILPYAPSEGLLEEVLARHAAAPGNHVDWTRLGRAFRRFHALPLRVDERPRIMAQLGYALAKEMGPEVWDTLAEFRFPVSRDTEREIDDLIREHYAAYREAADGSDFAGLVRLAGRAGWDYIAGQARYAALSVLDRTGRGQGKAAERIRRELGVIDDFHIAGPFYPGRGSGLCTVFPPERELDLDREYPGNPDPARWVDPRSGATTRLAMDARGVVEFRYPYLDRAVAYALAHVTVPEATEAVAFVGEDDEAALWVNGVQVGRMHGTRGVDTDQERWPLPLRAGRNELLLKVANHYGRMGCCLRIVAPDGSPIPGLRTDLEPPEARAARAVPAFRPEFLDDYRRRHLGRSYEVTAGRFRIRNKELVGEADGRLPDWRPFSKADGFPKDYPAALLWLRKARARDRTDFRWRVGLAEPRVPKICLTFDGEGRDIAQSGWSLIMWASGRGGEAHLERYDYLHYFSEFEMPANWPDSVIEVERVDGEVTVKVGGTVVFDHVSAPPLPLTRFGLAVWGADPRIRSMSLELPRR